MVENSKPIVSGEGLPEMPEEIILAPEKPILWPQGLSCS